MYPVTIKDLPARRVACIPHRGAYSALGAVFEKFSEICQTRGLWPQMGEVVGVFMDNPETVPEADLRSMAGAVFQGSDLPDGLTEFPLPAGRTAIMTFTGPYSDLPKVYGYLFGSWLPESGENMADAPSYEVYQNDPRDTAPEDLVTEIHVPLA